jgi:hypothetical protein
VEGCVAKTDDQYGCIGEHAHTRCSGTGERWLASTTRGVTANGRPLPDPIDDLVRLADRDGPRPSGPSLFPVADEEPRARDG